MSELKEITPELIAKKALVDGVELTLTAQPSLDYFKGHFPNAPILAGVVQLDWAVRYAREYLQLSGTTVKQVEVLKFQEIIQAGQSIKLVLTQKSAEKFVFKFQSDQCVHSSGRVLLEVE